MILIGLLIFLLLLTFFAPEIYMSIFPISSNPETILAFQVVGLMIIAIIIFRKILFYRCKVCKKWFSMAKYGGL